MSELLYPAREVTIGDWVLSEGVAMELCLYSGSTPDWGKLQINKDYLPKLDVREGEAVLIRLGTENSLNEVFRGFLRADMDGAGEVTVRDATSILEQTWITETFLDCTPQEIIRYCLAQAGIHDYRLSDQSYSKRQVYPVTRTRVADLLGRLLKDWGLTLSYGFRRGVFYWGMPDLQEEQYVISYGSNLLDLIQEDGQWIVETICLPKLQPGHTIILEHPDISGELLVDKIRITVKKNGIITYMVYGRMT